ncbi:unnamed protein product [Clonostachys rosea]|uniref:RRM domain-containing protein n=1 Tax=Bionectria ochroleuca TaxID=29856 RepID=A0ABY6UBE9_BIOOC|nr:unnamed protein product [Clonostachys rosea]
MVHPGAVTGVYYITFCNVCVHPGSVWSTILCAQVSNIVGEIQLPAYVTWQELKRHITQVCEVDRVEIFPASTSGWVRLKGHLNFEKAWALLKHGYQDRDLRPSGKNRFESLMIKERFPEGHLTGHSQPVIAGPWQQMGGDRRYGPRHRNYRIPKTQACQPHSHASLSPNPVRTNNSDQIWSPPGTTSNSGRSGYLLPMRTETPAPSAALTSGGRSCPQRPCASHACECSDDSAGHAAVSNNSVPTKLMTPLDSRIRKALVKGFSIHATESEVRFWIHDTCGPLGKNICRLDVPSKKTGSSNSSFHKQICGFALVVYRCPSVAAKAVGYMHKGECNGAPITARLVHDSEWNSPMPASSSRVSKRPETSTIQMQASYMTPAVPPLGSAYPSCSATDATIATASIDSKVQKAKLGGEFQNHPSPFAVFDRSTSP